jgi:integrase
MARQASTEVVRRAYVVTLPNGHVRHVPERRRETTGPSNGEINRELTTLKRMFRLAVQAGKLLHAPHIPLLREDNVRTGFFEAEQLTAVLRHLPVPIRPVIMFAYVTGWRIASEILPLEWRQVDFDAGEIRLNPGTTKNREGRVFPMTPELRALLTERLREAKEQQRDGRLLPWVFFRLVANGRRGPTTPQPIRAFTKAWAYTCRAAGCPGRIPHDLRQRRFGIWCARAFPNGSPWP